MKSLGTTHTWGREVTVVNTDLYCFKEIHLTGRGDHQSSLHYHRIKDETFIIRKGVIHLELGAESLVLNPSQIIHIPAGTPHRFRCLSSVGLIFEVSTHHEDSDTVRLEEST